MLTFTATENAKLEISIKSGSKVFPKPSVNMKLNGKELEGALLTETKIDTFGNNTKGLFVKTVAHSEATRAINNSISWPDEQQKEYYFAVPSELVAIMPSKPKAQYVESAHERAEWNDDQYPLYSAKYNK